MERECLLVLAWADSPNQVRLVPCQDQREAFDEIKTMVLFSPEDLQVVAFGFIDDAHRFKSQWPSIAKGEWFDFSPAMKVLLLEGLDSQRETLQAAMPSSIDDYLRWPEWNISHAERRRLNIEAGRLPSFVQDATDYVLWAVAAVNAQRSYCCSRDIIRHPANDGLYNSSTIYNVLAESKKKGLIKEDVIATSKVFSLTNAGTKFLKETEAASKAPRPRKSARSMYGGLL
jgi:hypothetical protein